MKNMKHLPNFPPKPIVVNTGAGDECPARLKPLVGVVMMAGVWLLTGVSLTLSVFHSQFAVIGIMTLIVSLVVTRGLFYLLFEGAPAPQALALMRTTHHHPCELSVPVELHNHESHGDDGEVISLLGDFFTKQKPRQLP